MVINMSLGGNVEAPDHEAAIDCAIAAGVIVVASAGNDGEDGMGLPGAYSQVISAGASGWTEEWLNPTTGTAFYRLWWLKDGGALGLPAGSGEVADPTPRRTSTSRTSAAVSTRARTSTSSRRARGCAARSRATPGYRRTAVVVEGQAT